MKTSWKDATHRMDGYECLWQDLDGLHVEGAPSRAPSTSILWAWPTNSASEQPLLRLRIDGDRVWVAECPANLAERAKPVIAWGNNDHRVDHARSLPGTDVDTVKLKQVREDVPWDATDTLPVTFWRRA